ncbi:MAG: hypothetical protein ACRDK9_10345 [Solirubrobacterales bacterium]
MKPPSAAAVSRAPERAGIGRDDDAWRERSARLYRELERPARAMVRRAFRGAFGDDELDDVYASAWVGTLRALASREAELSDEEIRRYVFTAVANQASKELRRRGRKPTASLELVRGVPDHGPTPEERAAGAEQSRVTRDLLSSLPPRRRAVMLLRYGWGLEPSQVRALISGLSPRAYRKEITRGVDQLTEAMRRFERGEWCDDREPLLKAYAAGFADNDQRRQAEAHLSHCRDCSGFVARLTGRLHDLGGGLVVPGAIDGIDGHLSLADRAGDLGDRVREAVAGVLSRGSADLAADAGNAGAAAVGARGAGAAGAGVAAKLAGIGTAGKLAVACLGGGAAATACIAAGVAPLGTGGDPSRAPEDAPQVHVEPAAVTAPASLPAQLGNAVSTPAPAPVAPADDGQSGPSESEPAPDPEQAQPVVDPATPPQQREFGVAATATPATTAPAPAPADTESAGGSAVQQEFGP